MPDAPVGDEPHRLEFTGQSMGILWFKWLNGAEAGKEAAITPHWARQQILAGQWKQVKK
jgi:hypothetical protein